MIYADFEEFKNNFGSNLDKYDANNDGKVDFDDFFIFSDNFGKGCNQEITIPQEYMNAMQNNAY